MISLDTMQETTNASKLRILYVGIAPPENHCGVRVVLHRHLVQRRPFEVLVATDGEYLTEPQPVHVALTIPRPIHRLRKSRFGPAVKRWILDYQNLIWAKSANRQLSAAVREFRPDVVLTLADNCLSEMARRTAKAHGLPLAALFLDWFPIMDGHFGSNWSRELLSRRFRSLYRQCDLAICTSEGMRHELGAHPNCQVVYPMAGSHTVQEQVFPPRNGKFRLVYVGSVERFYGRMIQALLNKFEEKPGFEFIVVGPNADWPEAFVRQAREKGVYLGFRPPEKAAEVLAGADALLVAMSFEKQYELFMRTSFTTKFLDYSAFGKPIIVWGPDYCTPSVLVAKRGGAVVVTDSDPARVFSACERVREDSNLRLSLCRGAKALHDTLFNPDRLQEIFVSSIEKLVAGGGRRQPVGNLSLSGNGSK